MVNARKNFTGKHPPMQKLAKSNRCQTSGKRSKSSAMRIYRRRSRTWQTFLGYFVCQTLLSVTKWQRHITRGFRNSKPARAAAEVEEYACRRTKTRCGWENEKQIIFGTCTYQAWIK